MISYSKEKCVCLCVYIYKAFIYFHGINYRRAYITILTVFMYINSVCLCNQYIFIHVMRITGKKYSDNYIHTTPLRNG